MNPKQKQIMWMVGGLSAVVFWLHGCVAAPSDDRFGSSDVDYLADWMEESNLLTGLLIPILILGACAFSSARTPEVKVERGGAPQVAVLWLCTMILSGFFFFDGLDQDNWLEAGVFPFLLIGGSAVLTVKFGPPQLRAGVMKRVPLLPALMAGVHLPQEFWPEEWLDKRRDLITEQIRSRKLQLRSALLLNDLLPQSFRCPACRLQIHLRDDERQNRELACPSCNDTILRMPSSRPQ